MSYLLSDLPRIARQRARGFRLLLAAVSFALLACASIQGSPVEDASSGMAVQLGGDHARIGIAADGRGWHLQDIRNGTDYGPGSTGSPWARILVDGEEHGATVVQVEDATDREARILLSFEDTDVMATLQLRSRDDYFTLEVVSVQGDDVEELTFVDVPLDLKGSPEEPFAACALALNLRTNVREIPGLSTRLRALAFRKLGFSGAGVALVASPPGRMRDILKKVVSQAPDLPRSTLGGPWALDAEVNRGSYLFNFGGLTEANVDEWIAVAKQLGFTQIDFHGGRSFRFGDCRPDPETYPEGFASLKAVIDRLHAVGLKAGLHTYAFFLDKRCPWVTPVPDPRLGTDATFTLAGPLAPDATTLRVVESTKGMSAVTGFFVRNSATLRAGDELITYSEVVEGPPHEFRGCTRGALGTRAAPHAGGEKVHHLKECFGLFAPGGDTTLLAEVAAKTAEAFNTCGFDMIYMDALDGEDILGGAAYGWHYGSKYVYEVFRRLERPAVMEMSTFHHHLWCVRSRMGAWDHPRRSHKRFVDIHCGANASLERMFLPGQLGWWAVKTWTGHQGEPTFTDDIEYLCGKALGHGVGLSLMGIDPQTVRDIPAYGRLAEIFREYEGLRLSGEVDEATLARLREPGVELTLVRPEGNPPAFEEVRYLKHRVEGLDGWSDRWEVDNPFEKQPVAFRIEALLSAEPYDGEGAQTVVDFTDPDIFARRASARGVTLDLRSVEEPLRAGAASGELTATSEGLVERRASWAETAVLKDPPLDLRAKQALGVWIHGDGKGAVLNFQLRCPPHIVAGIGEHYVEVDFTGWRYFQLIEPEGERYEDYSWPYGHAYAIYREHVDYAHIASLGLWCNNLPAGEKVTCALSPIRALPLVEIRITRPAITIRGSTLTLPVELETGCYLEYLPGREPSQAKCRVYGRTGGLLSEVAPRGDVPYFEPGLNEVSFGCDASGEVKPRARVTAILRRGLPPVGPGKGDAGGSR